jgi:hypothetical protein
MASNFSKLTVRIATLVEPNAPVIRDATFRGCTILGPALIAPAGAGQITNSRFDADPSGLFWVPADDRPSQQPSGVIVAINCIFDDCTFVGIGIATTRDKVANMREGFGPAPHEKATSNDRQGGMNVRAPS